MPRFDFSDPYGLEPEQVNALQTRRRQVNTTYGLGMAQNRFERNRTGREFRRGKVDLLRQFGKARRELPQAYAAGGLLNSGLYQKGIADLGQERIGAFGQLRGQYQDVMGGLRLAGRQLGQVRQSSLNDIDSQRAASRAALASSLRRANGS